MIHETILNTLKVYITLEISSNLSKWFGIPLFIF